MRKETATQRVFRIFTGALNGAAERWNAFVPILAVIIGVVLMRSIPPTTSWRLFKSEQERNDMFARFNFSQAPGIPLVIVGPNCAPCTTLLAELDGASVPYTPISITDGAVGQEIASKVKKEMYITDLPLVVLETNLLESNLKTIKSWVPASH